MSVTRAFVLLAVCSLALPVWAGPAQGSRLSLSPETRKAARKLANSWVDTASQNNINSFAYRSAAFSGMVPNVMVTLDGRRQNAGKALTDCAWVLLEENDNARDLRAIRDTIYVLNEIAEGRTFTN